ncbi:MAG: hypothetical protein FWE89_06010 [Syntrophaceae bacterium]|nr:hypothetical protein [Syntrophaceae bacterium]
MVVVGRNEKHLLFRRQADAEKFHIVFGAGAPRVQNSAAPGAGLTGHVHDLAALAVSDDAGNQGIAAGAHAFTSGAPRRALRVFHSIPRPHHGGGVKQQGHTVDMSRILQACPV